MYQIVKSSVMEKVRLAFEFGACCAITGGMMYAWERACAPRIYVSMDSLQNGKSKESTIIMWDTVLLHRNRWLGEDAEKRMKEIHTSYAYDISCLCYRSYWAKHPMLRGSWHYNESGPPREWVITSLNEHPSDIDPTAWWSDTTKKD